MCRLPVPHFNTSLVIHAFNYPTALHFTPIDTRPSKSKSTSMKEIWLTDAARHKHQCRGAEDCCPAQRNRTAWRRRVSTGHSPLSLCRSVCVCLSVSVNGLTFGLCLYVYIDKMCMFCILFNFCQI